MVGSNCGGLERLRVQIPVSYGWIFVIKIVSFVGKNRKYTQRGW